MSDSTTQQKKSQGNNAAQKEVDMDLMSKFEKDLLKKVRNKQKKIKEIEELEKKVKKKEIVANTEQLDKIASKSVVTAEIEEVNGYMKLYQDSQKGKQESEEKLKKQFSKDLHKSQLSSVRTFANMVTLHMMVQAGQQIPEELEEGVKHFSSILNKFTGSGESSVNWRQERDALVNDFKKLVTNSKDTVEDTDISYEDLNTGIAESISSNDYPEVVTFGAKKEATPEVVEEPEEEVQEEKVEEVTDVPEPVEETVKEEETQEAVVEADKTEEPAATESKPDSPEGDEEKKDGEDTVKRGRGGRGRGNRGDRGNWRGGERGDFRGKRGDGERGGRGDYRGRGRPNTGYKRNGLDDEGFETVKAAGDRGRGQRGRGFRGQRGDRGNWRGGERGGAERGAERGGGRGRGERPPRKGQASDEKPAGDLPGVATAVTEPAAAKE